MIHETEPGAMLGLAIAEFRKGDAASANATLDRLSRRTRISAPPRRLCSRLAFSKPGALPEALNAYERLLLDLSRRGSKRPNGAIASEIGAEQRAHSIFAEIRKSVERGPAFYRRAQREWDEIARHHA
jgi:hypothetical protein